MCLHLEQHARAHARVAAASTDTARHRPAPPGTAPGARVSVRSQHAVNGDPLHSMYRLRHTYGPPHVGPRCVRRRGERKNAGWPPLTGRRTATLLTLPYKVPKECPPGSSKREIEIRGTREQIVKCKRLMTGKLMAAKSIY